MDVGMITCNYFMRIYGNREPEGFDWGKMVAKYRAEFTRADFIKLAGEIRMLGFDFIEIWEPMFSYLVYSDEDAAALAADLKKMGFHGTAYCIGGWGKADVPHMERAYRFAKALGAKVLTGCIPLADASETVVPELERCGRLYGMKFGIENHPAPNIESPEDVRRVTEGCTAVGANFDTGIYNMQGYDVLAAAKLLKGRIFHVHLKDTVKGGHDCLPIGEGSVPVAELIRLLQAEKYDCMLSVEFEYIGDPAPGLAKSLEYVKKLLG